MILEATCTDPQKNTLASHNYLSWTQERWEGILEFKRRFLQNPREDPRQCPYLSQEVANSWIRCQKLGIDPKGSIMHRQLTHDQYQKILDENQLLINITRPLINTFKNMALLTSGYIVYLCDINGVFLLQAGEMVRVKHEGVVWSENTIGTCAHSLCLQLKQPVHLMGPEHYSLHLNNIMAAAVPITNENGEIIATLILGQPLKQNPWGDYFANMRSHTLGLITALASAVEAQIKQHKTNEKLRESNINLQILNHDLQTARGTLETTLSLIDEGIITIDANGNIINLNQEGARILGLQSLEKAPNISNYLTKQSRVMSLVQKGYNGDVEETIISGTDEQPYFINIRPVIDKITNENEGAVLKLTHIDKLNALVASRTGAVASYRFEDIIGVSKEFQKNISLAKRFAHSKENILIIGESGTGKELFAQAIHNEYRPQGPFMAVNCAAMPRELIESELFGYEGGSFTGAERKGRPGKIEMANGGTLFLDEVGDMPLELQAVLLRTLEDKQVMRIGGRSYKKVDFRLLAATNKDLYKMVQENQFREDLYFRLSVLNITLPPLRERREDIELFSKYFVETYCQKLGWNTYKIAPEAQKLINEYDWPGNVRQLQNAMIYAVNSAQDELIKVENLPNYILVDSNFKKINAKNSDSLSDTLKLEELEKKAIVAALAQANNDMFDASLLLGISRSTLYRKIKAYGISQ
jgi:transcriptional regulator with PAS, ATPase and Fis domain